MSNLIQSFPIQLLILHLKKNHFLLLFWVILFLMVTFLLGERYGIPLLFLDPEYLGDVSFLSFFILGFAFGAFLMVWNVTSYILHAHHFPFLATLHRPFGVYSLNNSLIPIAFLIVYIIQLLVFQRDEGLLRFPVAALRLGGLFSGAIVFIALSMAYFFSTNKNIFQLLGLKGKEEPTAFDDSGPTWGSTTGHMEIRVATYLNHELRLKAARPVGHYPAALIFRVYRQHHINALFIELTALLLIVVLGHLIDYPVFRIPAASSILLLFAIVIMVVGAVSYWLKGWKILVSIIGILLIDLIIGQNLLQYKNRAYGIGYAPTEQPYTLDRLQTLNGPAYTDKDKTNMLTILQNWRNKFPADTPPKMVFINCSGGGLRASMFVMDALQQADSITGGNLMEHTILMSGASGGMIAAAYYRELYYQSISDEAIRPYDAAYLNKISSDMLNALAYTSVVNDLFFPWKNYTYNDLNYRKDRGYIFEKALNENTDSVLHRPISYYAAAEQQATIPLLLFAPTIINDERRLFIGAQSYSFLGYPVNRRNDYSPPEVDGVDIHYLLEDMDVSNLLLTSAIRMSCTFPYILPNVHLPTTPEVELMDAGIRDNYGVDAAVRFADTFKEWIDRETSGVIMLNLRGLEQDVPIRTKISQGVLEKIFSPIGNLYLNWVEVQDYQNDFLLHHLHTRLDVPLEVISIAYQPSAGARRASLSFHLTNREKRDIMESASSTESREAYAHLAELLRTP